MTRTLQAWWQIARWYVLMYLAVIAMAALAVPDPAPLYGWKFATIASGLAALAGTLGMSRVLVGATRGRLWSYLERVGLIGIVVNETLHAAIVTAEMLAGGPPNLLARASAHAALAIAVWLAGRRRPVVRKVEVPR